ncbi:MAG: hypothetical protein N4P87_00575 [Candidatus Lightella neohaematopini]|nr:hypothetical protein [Candidatus Lightella neohaematopini]
MFDIIINSNDINELLLSYCFTKKIRITIIIKSLLNNLGNIETIFIIN